MKRALSTVIAAALLCASLLTGCVTVPAESVSYAQPSSDDEFLVGVILYESKRSESGSSYEHLQAIEQAMEDLGLSPDTDLKIRDGIIDADNELRANIEDLVVMGCDVIFGTHYDYSDTMSELAEQYPSVVFCNAEGVLCNSTNYINYSGRTYQAFYLAGLAAGYKSVETGNNNMGFVSTWGDRHTETCSDINAFTLGALSVNPDAAVYVYPVLAWSDPDAEHRAAQNLISRYHCGVVAQDCLSPEPLLMADADHIYGCGYSYDMTDEAPDAHLTSPSIDWSVFYKLAISTAMNETSASEFVTNIGGNYYGSFTEGFADITPLTDNNVPEVSEAVEAARALMISGEWDVFSGTALVFEGEEGSVSFSTVPRDLLDNEGNVLVQAGEGSLNIIDIRGYMNYFVEGVVWCRES